MPTCADLTEKALNGRRLTPAEGVRLLTGYPLAELGGLSQSVRLSRLPRRAVTFVADTNPNYTNICEARCPFCAFSRNPGQEGAYTLGVKEVVEKARWAQTAGATTLLLQGGLNSQLPFSYYLELIEALKEGVPGMHLHLFSAPEIQLMARVSGKNVREVLKELWNAGLRTLPGGGAEVLSDRVRSRLAAGEGRPKATVREWIEVHEAAHRIGFKSTATMMYGHLEEPEDVIGHLEAIRALQDETGGFTAFVPWSFKSANTRLASNCRAAAGPAAYLRHIAVARLFLDNFDHIQASWFSEGKSIGQIALHFGADDFGGILLEENVHRESGFVNKATADEVKQLIGDAGFTPVQRNTLYIQI